MTFQPGDRVTVAGVIVADDWPVGESKWVTVEFKGYRVLVKESDVTLVAPAETPGQRAYAAWCAADQAPGMRIRWEDMNADRRARWETIAKAARS